jgi:hypothetical protein
LEVENERKLKLNLVEVDSLKNKETSFGSAVHPIDSLKIGLKI